MIISPYKNGFCDQPVFNITSQIKTDTPIIQLTQFTDFIFDEKWYELDKYILADFLELGANGWNQEETLLFGVNGEKFTKSQTEDWLKFNQFVKDKNPVIYFKRELLNKDKADNIYPIEFPALFQTPPVQSKEEFDSRELELFFNWGYSHELRRATHGLIFLHATTSNIEVVDSFQNIEQTLKERNGHSRTWATIFTPHFSRVDIQTVYYFQSKSKLSLSLYGAGTKCFRNLEAPLNSIMVMQDDDISWGYDWIDGFNCIKIPKAKTFEEIRGLENQYRAIETIEQALKRDDLYEIYKNGIATCDKYRIDNYVNNYLQPLINSI
jgi:hypothetical protein